MSGSLDKSLDDIISASRKGKKIGAKPTKVGKKVGASNKKPIVASFKNTGLAARKAKIVAAVTAAAAAPTVDLSYATKVVVHNLPKDLKQDNIKDFFQSQVGGVQTISMNYNEKGQFKGIATIIFKSSKNASKAVEKYNGAPIDGGSSKLKLELIVDPSKKPLASRIVANKAVNPKVAAAKQQLQKKKKTAANGPAAAAQAGAKAKQPKKKPAPKKTKKTVEELDQEMADYFT